MEVTAIGLIGQHAVFHVEEVLRAGQGPAQTLLQHLMERIVKALALKGRCACLNVVLFMVGGPDGVHGAFAVPLVMVDSKNATGRVTIQNLCTMEGSAQEMNVNRERVTSFHVQLMEIGDHGQVGVNAQPPVGRVSPAK